MAAWEHRASGLRLRATGRTLTGPAIVYGDVSPTHRERFEAGAFDLDDGATRWLNVRHDFNRVIAFTGGGGLDLEDSPERLMVRAELPRIPAAERALDEVRAGKLRGFSVEFRALSERSEGGIRVVRRAELGGVGLVPDPSYRRSVAEVRQQSGRSLRAFIPGNQRLGCECGGPECHEAVFETGGASVSSIFQPWLQGVIDEAVENVAARIESGAARELLAVRGGYGSPLGSLSKGTLRLREREGGALGVEVDLPDSEAGRAVLADNEAAGVIVRPYLDPERSEFTEANGVRTYTRAHVRSFVVGATDARQGWPEPDFAPWGGLLERSIAPSERTLWL